MAKRKSKRSKSKKSNRKRGSVTAPIKRVGTPIDKVRVGDVVKPADVPKPGKVKALIN